MIFQDSAPFMFLAIVLSGLFLFRIDRNDLFSIDGIFSIFGYLLGLAITTLCFFYSNNYMISIGPILSVCSLLYLKLRNTFKNSLSKNGDHLDIKYLMILDILIWTFVFSSIICYYKALPFSRPPIFFYFISAAFAMLGLKIYFLRSDNSRDIYFSLFNIFVISLIVRGSGYFVSPYPIGSDPWGHIEYIKFFLSYHHILVPTQFDYYYCNFPISHLYVCITKILTDLDLNDSFFILGFILAISTIFIYLVSNELTANKQISLFATLLVNLSDSHIEWSIEIIAMTLGIAYYSVLFYLIIRSYSYKLNKSLIVSLLVLICAILIWTHTISGFIFLISIISLYLGSLLYFLIYRENTLYNKGQVATLEFCVLFFIILIYHWIDPNYPFFNSIAGILNSLFYEAQFLGYPVKTASVRWETLLFITGFLICILFAVIGSLSCLRANNTNILKFSIIFMNICLFFIFFFFPLMGLKNICPQRWQPFILISLVLLSSIGIFQIYKPLRKTTVAVTLPIILFIFALTSLNTPLSNMDSPLYANDIIGKNVWTDSEMQLFLWVNSKYNGTVISDVQTSDRPLNFLQDNNRIYFNMTPQGQFNYNSLSKNLVVWREMSLKRPIVIASGKRFFEMCLGNPLENYLSANFNCLCDVGRACAYLDW